MGKVWLLVETRYAGQCTGFSYFETVLGVFLSIPTVEEVAPFLSEHLSPNMGEAISQVMKVIKDKQFGFGHDEAEIELREVEVGKRLQDE